MIFYFLQIVFRDLVNHCLYITDDAGETYYNNRCHLELNMDIIQFSPKEEDYLFAIDSTNSSVSFLTYCICPLRVIILGYVVLS